MQTMKGLTPETRDVFHNFPNYKLSQSNAAKLSRLEPAKQKNAAILLASYQIRSVDEYQPEQVEGKSPRKSKQSIEFLESVAAVKDPTKGATGTPGLFVSEYRAFINEVQRRIGAYHEPYYEGDFSSLSQSEIDEMQSLTDSCCEMMQRFIWEIKEGKWQSHA